MYPLDNEYIPTRIVFFLKALLINKEEFKNIIPRADYLNFQLSWNGYKNFYETPFDLSPPLFDLLEIKKLRLEKVITAKFNTEDTYYEEWEKIKRHKISFEDIISTYEESTSIALPNIYEALESKKNIQINLFDVEKILSKLPKLAQMIEMSYEVDDFSKEGISKFLDDYIKQFLRGKLVPDENSHNINTFKGYSKPNGLAEKIINFYESRGKIFTIKSEELEIKEEDLALEFMISLEHLNLIKIKKLDLDSVKIEVLKDLNKESIFNKDLSIKKVKFSNQQKKVYEKAKLKPLNFIDLWELIWEKSDKFLQKTKDQINNYDKKFRKEHGEDSFNTYIKNRVCGGKLRTYQKFKNKFKEKLKTICSNETDKIINNLP